MFPRYYSQRRHRNCLPGFICACSYNFSRRIPSLWPPTMRRVSFFYALYREATRRVSLRPNIEYGEHYCKHTSQTPSNSTAPIVVQLRIYVRFYVLRIWPTYSTRNDNDENEEKLLGFMLPIRFQCQLRVPVLR